jgi:hypothetical protein
VLLEAHIEELTEIIERCRKVIIVSKAAIAAGGIWLLAFTFGALMPRLLTGSG